LNLLKAGSSRIAYLIDDENLAVEGVLKTLLELRAGHTILDTSVVDGLVSEHRGLH
jgi:hypothetical protein